MRGSAPAEARNHARVASRKAATKLAPPPSASMAEPIPDGERLSGAGLPQAGRAEPRAGARLPVADPRNARARPPRREAAEPKDPSRESSCGRPRNRTPRTDTQAPLHSTLKPGLAQSESPVFFIASLCAFVGYPLCRAKPYTGSILSNRSMSRSRATLARMDAAMIDGKRLSPLIKG